MPTKTKTQKPTTEPPAEPKPFFCGSQEVIADAVAEMITTGATEENLALVIHAVIDHDWRRRFNDAPSDSYSERKTSNMLDELAVARVKRTKLEKRTPRAG